MIRAALLGVLLGLVVAPAAAQAGLTFSARPENRTILVPGPGEGTIQIEVIVPDMEWIGEDRPRLNLALVIDRSGSMAELGKLEYAKAAAHEMIDLLAPDDRLAIVAYDHQVRDAAPLPPGGGPPRAAPDRRLALPARGDRPVGRSRGGLAPGRRGPPRRVGQPGHADLRRAGQPGPDRTPGDVAPGRPDGRRRGLLLHLRRGRVVRRGTADAAGHRGRRVVLLPRASVGHGRGADARDGPGLPVSARARSRSSSASGAAGTWPASPATSGDGRATLS